MKRWPLKVLLVHPEAKFMQEDKFTIAADCSLLVHKEIVKRFGEETVIIGCPMLEDPRRFFDKLKLIIEKCKAKKIDVFTMEVPCCHAIHMMVDKVLQQGIKIRRMVIAVSDACAGCGRCVNSCPTRALKIVDGKAKLIDERLCDGFGSCIAVCPENALYIEEKEAELFDWNILNKIDFEDFLDRLGKHYMPAVL